MNKIPEPINLNEWSEFGGGYTANSFYHTTDDSIMMKLYAPFMRPDEALNELELSERIAGLGLPVAKPLKYVVSNDGRYGAVFERLKNKRSIARILADEPERIDEMARIFAEEGKKLHQKKCDTNQFVSMDETLLSAIQNTDYLPEALKLNAIKVINETPKMDTCLHGDFHIGNMLIVDDKPIFIDLGEFSYGNPLYDLGMLYFQVVCGTEEICMNLYHITKARFKEFWDLFVKYYFDSTEGIEELLRPYVMLTGVKYSAKIGSVPDTMWSAFEGYL